MCARGDDTVGNPHRAQIYQSEFFDLLLLLKLDKQFPVEQFEATASQSTVPPPPFYICASHNAVRDDYAMAWRDHGCGRGYSCRCGGDKPKQYVRSVLMISFNLHNYKLRVSNTRTVADLHFNAPFESSKIPGGWAHFSRLTFVKAGRRPKRDAVYYYYYYYYYCCCCCCCCCC